MKLKYIIHTFVGLAFLWMNTSCDSYLDKLPDNRANLDSEDNITDLLVSAYPTVSICMLGLPSWWRGMSRISAFSRILAPIRISAPPQNSHH